jgi:hypothetical protein
VVGEKLQPQAERFTYDNLGKINSKSDLQEGNWVTCYFEIK